MDYLEEEWYDKLKSVGMSDTDARLLARIKAKMDRDATLLSRIKEEGFDGFCRWVEIHCKDIYYAVKNALQSAWEWIVSLPSYF